MTDKRRLTVSVTLFITADLTSEGNDTRLALHAVSHNVMGSLLPIDGAPETTPEWREAMATVAAKHGLQYLMDEMKGEHKDKPAPFMQQGGDA